MNAEPIRITSGKQATPGRGANGLSYMEVTKDRAFGGESIEVRSLETLRSEDADVSITLIVCENNDDVRKAGSVSDCGAKQHTGA